jgi:hypothetical protein
MQIIKNFYNKFFTKKLNVNASDSARNLTAAIGEATTTYSYDLTSNPSGSFRALNVDPLVRIMSGAPIITQPLYGSNLKVELNGTAAANGNPATTKTGGVFAINAYSVISGTGHTVDKNVGISVLADVGNNLTGTTVTNNFGIEISGLASRTTTVVTNARSMVINCPNHGTTRRGLLIEAEQITGVLVGTNNRSFENLGTSKFAGAIICDSSITMAGSLTVTGSGVITAPSLTLSGAFKLALSTVSFSSSLGVIGEIKVDADYIYVCTATNTWKRAALSSW